MHLYPRLYELRSVSVVGHLGHTVPFNLGCPQCGREVGHFHEVELVLDQWPECDLVGATAEYFVTDRLISRLESVEATGYEHYPAALSMSGEFRLWHPRVRKPLKKIPRFDYFVITGRADGPWVWVTRKADTCPACGQVRALSPDRETFDAMQAERAGDVPRTPILVYPDTWNGEDFFYLSEPGPPIITERIANILDQTGNLRKRTVSGSERESICRTTPKVAARMERLNWEVAVCCELGPAGWVE